MKIFIGIFTVTRGHCQISLKSECDGQDAAHGNCAAAYLASGPARHRVDDAHRLAVKRLVTRTADDGHIAHLSIGADDETAQHAALNAILIGMVGILACLVYKIDEAALTARKLGLHVNVVELIDLDVAVTRTGIYGGHMAYLSTHGHRHN